MVSVRQRCFSSARIRRSVRTSHPVLEARSLSSYSLCCSALDIWSAGIILLCFLTRRFPFFNSNDDTEALAEIMAIFGRRKMERCAALHSAYPVSTSLRAVVLEYSWRWDFLRADRTLQTNIRDYDDPPHHDLHALVRALNPPIIVENSPDPYGPIPASPDTIDEWYPDSELAQCVDLLKRCLEWVGFLPQLWR